MKVNINPELLLWAIEQGQPDLTTLSERFPKYQAWINGEDSPSFPQLEAFCKFLKVPLGYMFLEQPPPEPEIITEFRTIDNYALQDMSKNLRDTIVHMDLLRTWMREYRIEEGIDTVEFIGKGAGVEEPKRLADIFLNVLELQVGFSHMYKKADDLFKALRAKIEALGVLVFIKGYVGGSTRRTLNTTEFRAFTLADDIAPVIFINGRDAIKARIFSLVHEFMHLLLGRDGISKNVQAETICNRATITALAPIELIVHEAHEANVEKPYTANIVSYLAKIFNISDLSMVYQLYNHGLVRKTTVDEIKRQSEEAIQHRGSGDDSRVTFDYQFSKPLRQAIANQLQTGRLQYQQAFTLTGLSQVRTINDMAERAML